jgi:hypothetical protein
MRAHSIILIALIFLGTFAGFDGRVNAAPKEKVPAALESVEGKKEVQGGMPPIYEQKIILHPFFRLQKKDSKAWIERILVTFLTAVPQGSLTYDFNNPNFRKILYDLLQSAEPEANIQAQAVATLNRQLEKKIDASAQISRSVIIVH